jgi:hypothetical protein
LPSNGCGRNRDAQSIRFLRSPGIEKLYSGDARMNASLPRSLLLNLPRRERAFLPRLQEPPGLDLAERLLVAKKLEGLCAQLTVETHPARWLAATLRRAWPFGRADLFLLARTCLLRESVGLDLLRRDRRQLFLPAKVIVADHETLTTRPHRENRG